MNNTPAFPTQSGYVGMTMYEYIAIQAMKSAMANPIYADLTYEQIAKLSATMATHMLKELKP